MGLSCYIKMLLELTHREKWVLLPASPIDCILISSSKFDWNRGHLSHLHLQSGFQIIRVRRGVTATCESRQSGARAVAGDRLAWTSSERWQVAAGVQTPPVEACAVS